MANGRTLEPSPLEITLSSRFHPTRFTLTCPHGTSTVLPHLERAINVPILEDTFPFAHGVPPSVPPSSIPGRCPAQITPSPTITVVAHADADPTAYVWNWMLDSDDDALIPDAEEAAHITTAAAKLGWGGGYSPQKEAARMRLDKRWWVVVDINADLTISPTYGRVHVVPAGFVAAAIAANRVEVAVGGGVELAAVATVRAGPRAYPPQSPMIVAAASNAVAGAENSAALVQLFKGLAAHRVKGRFPVLSWKNPCSQPKTGLLGNRSAIDELMIAELVKSVSEEFHASFCHQTVAGDPPFCIMDARGYSAAKFNNIHGGGFENTSNYPTSTRIQFMSLPNIHSIASSYAALLKAVTTSASSPNWFGVLEATGWLGNVSDLLNAAGGRDGIVGKVVDLKASILVHCSDGWDRTTQLVSLATIMLDPFYRTIAGFRVLIEREWIHFGHPHNARNGFPPPFAPSTTHYAHATPTLTAGGGGSPPHTERYKPIESSASPIFILFLTCLHHLVDQFPAEFEFSDALLVVLARASAGCGPFGDFLCNNEVRLNEGGIMGILRVWVVARPRGRLYVRIDSILVRLTSLSLSSTSDTTSTSASEHAPSGPGSANASPSS
ncbi:protein-tyrosine phosphatase-like protein [Blyttiomyces helicus]|uniref:Protein-tyrosine phosphatase-like protein n=1 Tax=Blyttiomyces helicus TaxID=388810 RepID=A0A4P9WE77_9FUNG|nr:protein-tyrosine phosphatase-like protein [Blyttiomyces helicus]|eukprot:RKO91021.1 protein-tyrosine phosphatase-like protein [Blyttiomyces helicus]